MPGRRGHSALSLGVLMLAYRLIQPGLDLIPPVTLCLVLLQTGLFMGVLNPPWSSTDVCLSAYSVLQQGDYRRLFLAAVEHSSDMHLYYNMISLIYKGRILETRLGSRKFLVLLLMLTLGSGLCYTGLAEVAARYLHPTYRDQCAIGFSGVLFAMKVLNLYHESHGFVVQSSSRFLGFNVSVPTRYAVWVELLVIHVLVPRSSFIGHLSGILVGLAFCSMNYESLLRSIDVLFGGRPAYTYMRGTVRGGRRDDDDDDTPPHNTYTQPEQNYRTYSREDFNPSRRFDPVFQETGRRAPRYPAPRTLGVNVNQRPSYTYASGTSNENGLRPSAPSYEFDAEELRQQRLRRFQ